MKTIRITLFILIIIGLIALVTQKIWVPKLVDRILLSEAKKEIVLLPVAQIQSISSFEEGRQCYTFNHEATKDEPYTVNEFMDITIKGGNVVGTKMGAQSGPDITNGYTGDIKGTIENKSMNVIFSYTVEGSSNKEKEIYQASKTGIEKLRYPLIDSNKILTPDTTKEFKILNYSRVECEASN